MGLSFKIVQSERKLLNEVACDRCGKAVQKQYEGGWNPYGEPYSEFHEPTFDSFFLLEHSWGASSKKDGQKHEAVLCEDCYDLVFKDVRIKVTRYF